MKIGSFCKIKPIILAPMVGFSDFPFRVICKNLGADLLYTEFVRTDLVLLGVKDEINKLAIHEEEQPIGIQLFGSNKDSFKKTIELVEKFKPTFIDINCGCPLPWYFLRNDTMRHSGAVLLKNLFRFERLLKEIVKSTSLPVTVKVRLGWDDKNINVLDAAKAAEQAGVKAIAVHCRTRSQGCKGFANWSWLAKIKNVVSIPIIGNGDITSPEDAKRILETGCDAIMIGRSAICNPWIFKQVKYYLSTGKFLSEISTEERIKICSEHFKLSVRFYGKKKVISNFQKYYRRYFFHLPIKKRPRLDIKDF